MHIDLKVEIIPARQGDKLLYDKHSERLELSLNQISNGTFSIDEISTYLNQLLSYGDSWSAKQVASSYLQSVNKLDISLTDVLGIPYALQGDTGMANLLWEQWAKVSAIEEARAVLEDGISQLQNTEYEGTLHHTVLVSNLAHVIHLIGDFTEAEKLYRQAISMDPMFAEYHQDLASFLCDMQRMDEALKEIECALKLDPSMSEAWRLCGYILMHLGKPRKARDCYGEAVSLGDNLGIIDALRASYEADSPEWTILFGSKYRDFVIDAPSQVELELLILHARSKTDPFFDFRKALKVLQSSFPDDELINLAIKANT